MPAIVINALNKDMLLLKFLGEISHGPMHQQKTAQYYDINLLLSSQHNHNTTIHNSETLWKYSQTMRIEFWSIASVYKQGYNYKLLTKS